MYNIKQDEFKLYLNNMNLKYKVNTKYKLVGII